MPGHRQKRSRELGDAALPSVSRRRVLDVGVNNSDYNVVAAALLDKWAWGQMVRWFHLGKF